MKLATELWVASDATVSGARVATKNEQNMYSYSNGYSYSSDDTSSSEAMMVYRCEVHCDCLVTHVAGVVRHWCWYLGVPSNRGGPDRATQARSRTDITRQPHNSTSHTKNNSLHVFGTFVIVLCLLFSSTVCESLGITFLEGSGVQGNLKLPCNTKSKSTSSSDDSAFHNCIDGGISKFLERVLRLGRVISIDAWTSTLVYLCSSNHCRGSRRRHPHSRKHLEVRWTITDRD